MPAQLSSALEAEVDLATRVNRCDGVIDEVVPATARAYWDLGTDEQRRPVLTLALSDPFGYATADFAPEELASADHLRRRVHHLVGELVQSARRERIEIRDAFVTAEQLEDFRQRLNAIRNIAEKRPKLYNRVQMSPSDSRRMLITDFAVEVDADVAESVRQAIRDSGFNLRGDPLLDRHGIRDRVRELVDAHLHDGQAMPRYAICFETRDPADIHLLEISDEAPESQGYALEGIGLSAGDAVPGARSIVLYLVTPSALRRASQQHPNHPAVRQLRDSSCWFVYPDDGGESFYREFPELSGA
ncbi:MAG TPA: hypothetical protein VJ783_12430 [Pirellulales bacterium]|nr:hypothetical protein [Pirellulales bacterium]